MILHFVTRRGRRIDSKLPLRVHRNLHRKDGIWYSVAQDHLVIGYSKLIALRDVHFVVKQGGRERARRDRVRNVHAWVEGFLDPDTDWVLDDNVPKYGVGYSPFSDVPGFRIRDDESRLLVTRAWNAHFGPTGCTVRGVTCTPF